MFSLAVVLVLDVPYGPSMEEDDECAAHSQGHEEESKGLVGVPEAAGTARRGSHPY